jgi:hypothetical protein
MPNLGLWNRLWNPTFLLLAFGAGFGPTLSAQWSPQYPTVHPTLGPPGASSQNWLGWTQWGAPPGHAQWTWRQGRAWGWEVGLDAFLAPHAAAWGSANLARGWRATGGLSWKNNRVDPFLAAAWEHSRYRAQAWAGWTSAGPTGWLYGEYRPGGRWETWGQCELHPAGMPTAWTLGARWKSSSQNVLAAFSRGGGMQLVWESTAWNGGGPTASTSWGWSGFLGCSVGWKWPANPPAGKRRKWFNGGPNATRP